MDVRGLCLHSSYLTLGFTTLLELCHLLALYRWSGDFLTKNDISDLASRQRSDVDAVALSEVLQKRNQREKYLQAY